LESIVFEWLTVAEKFASLEKMVETEKQIKHIMGFDEILSQREQWEQKASLETLTIILNGAPYGDEKVWNALRMAKALSVGADRMKINIFFLGDAVTTAKKGQKPPEGFYNLEKMLTELIDQGVQVVVCRTCINARGLTQEDLVEGARVGTTAGDLAQWVKESQKILSF